MASTLCRSRLSSVCRLFKKLLPAGTSQFSSSCPVLQNSSVVHSMPFHRPAVGPHLCLVSLPTMAQCRSYKWYTDKRISKNLGVVGIADVEPDFTVIDYKTESQELVRLVNEKVQGEDQGRLFAVVLLAAAQRKITVEDVIVVEADFPPSIGDRIRLEKVLMVGGKDFSLFGQPLLSRDQVKIEATVVEKTLSHNRVWSTYRRRTRFRKMKVYRDPQCVLVINTIELGTLPET